MKGKIISQKKFTNKNVLNSVDKKKILSIINNFKKNRVVTERLINKEKILALNSVNNSNYAFLLRDGKNSRNKNRKIIDRNQYNDCSSNMINKFNNKTFGILEPLNTSPIYSTNLDYFRHQLINNFTEYNENMDLARKKYNDAMKIGEINDKKNIRLALEMEQKFYQNKFNIFEDKNFKVNYKNIINKIRQTHGHFRKSNIFKNNNKIYKSPRRKSQINIANNNILGDKINESNSKILNSANKKSPKKMKSDDINLNLFKNKIRFSKSKLNEMSNSNSSNERTMLDVKKIHNLKEKKRIEQRSNDLVNSIYEINNYPYEELQTSYSRDKVGDINIHNLSRAIKINIINKYLYNLEDDDLLLHNPKKLKEEIKEVEISCNKNNYKTNYNYSFLRNKLKKETLRKFKYIKDSRFGYPV